MTAIVISPIDPAPLTEPAARISLKPAGDHRGMANGAWWPRSRDLARELPPLIAALDKAWGQVNRATVNVHMWPDIPKRVRTGTHTLRVGWFDAEQDPNDICLLSYHLGGRWDLLVVPPELDFDTAARLMAAAADTNNRQTASALLAAVSAPAPRSASDTEHSRDGELEGTRTPEAAHLHAPATASPAIR